MDQLEGEQMTEFILIFDISLKLHSTSELATWKACTAPGIMGCGLAVAMENGRRAEAGMKREWIQCHKTKMNCIAVYIAEHLCTGFVGLC